MKVSSTVCRALLRNNRRLNHRGTLPPLSTTATSAVLPCRFFHSSPSPNVLPNFSLYSSKRFFCEATAEKPPAETAEESSEETAEEKVEETVEEVIERKCWNCDTLQTTEAFIFCDSCGCIQPADESIDYFKLFDFEQKFAIDEDVLEATYKEVHQKLQPDQVQSKSEKERQYAAEQSERFTEAHRVLNDPLSRGLYIIKLVGLPPRSERSDSDSDDDLSPENRKIVKDIEERVKYDPELQRIRRVVLAKLRPQDLEREDAEREAAEKEAAAKKEAEEAEANKEAEAKIEAAVKED